MSLFFRLATVIGNDLVVKLEDHAIVSTGGSSPQKAGLIVKRNGVLTLLSTSAGNSDESDEWVKIGRGSTIGDSFEARMTKSAGNVDAGPAALGTWLAITSDLEWSIEETVSGNSDSFDGTLEIRNAASGSVVASGFMEMQAGVT